MIYLFHVIIILSCLFISSKILAGYTLTLILIILASSITTYLFIRPENGLYFLCISSLFFNPYVLHSPFRIHLTHFIILISLGSIIIKNVLLRSKNWIRTRIDFPLIFFFCGYMISFIHVDNYNEYLKKLFILGMYVSGFFIATNILNSKEKIQRFLNFILVIVPFGVFYSIVRLLISPFRNKYFRLYGEFANPNDIADFLILLFPLMIYVVWELKTTGKKICGYFSLSITLTGIILTFSRSSWIALLISFMFIILLSNKKALILLFFIPLILFGTYIILTDSFYEIINFEDNTLLARKTLWEKAVEYIKEYPVFGRGAGSFYETAFPYDIKYFTGAFNIFLTIWVETGVLTTLIYVYIIFFILKTGFFNSLFLLKNYLLNIQTGLFIGIVAHTMHSFFEDMLFNVMTNWMLGIVTGLLFCCIYIYNNGDAVFVPPYKHA